MKSTPLHARGPGMDAVSSVQQRECRPGAALYCRICITKLSLPPAGIGWAAAQFSWWKDLRAVPCQRCHSSAGYHAELDRHRPQEGTPARPLISRLQDRGVLVLAAGRTVIRLLPPLIISTKQLDAGVDAICDVITG